MSVTRKHGLFKKAYELGVLCSVDVAVIIFEEKPGHHVKLYQYCSSDVHDIVQRHLRHDGEKDTRGPADFSGLPNPKFEDFGEGDDEELDDEDDSRRGVKRRNDGHIKPEDISLDINLSYNVAPMSVHGMNSTVPVSSDRSHIHNQLPPNKRARFAGTTSLSSDRSARDSYNISPTSPTFTGRAQHGQSNYNGFLSGTTTTPTTFHPDTPFATTPAPLTRDSRNGSSGTPSYPPRSTAYDAALYTPVIRHSMGSGGGSASGEGFNKYLDGEPRSRAPATSGSNVHLSSSVDWPDNGNPGYSSNDTVSIVLFLDNTQSSTPANENTWLDFLSNSPTHGTHSITNVSDAIGRRSSESVPWERGPTSRSSMNSPFTRSVAAVSDGVRRSRLSSSGSGENDPSASGGNNVPSGLGISVKQEKDVGT
ncbi:hypothetical protein GYMLUDRAFT_54263 [Collybiopsis luxurians FD-317 M1]|nr:hypothetical protein GYMLUDRAFT_54263 [Collybiopsis luxurians FD-317 M1]